MSKSHYYRNQSSGDGTWSEFFGDVYSGIAVGIGHPKWFIEKTIGRGWDAALASFGGGGRGKGRGGGGDRSFEETDRESSSSPPSNNNDRGLLVAGVGYGRTGTYSLALALDELGLPCLHTQHLYEEAEIFDHVVQNVFLESIRRDEAIMGRPDFDLIARAGYAATVDLPFALYFEQIRERYPDCKFILTTRESSEVWFRSWEMLTRTMTKPVQYTGFIFSHVGKLGHYMRWLFSVVNDDKTFLSHPFPLPPQNRERAIASYERHNQLVRDSIPPSHLLEYDVRQGWEPLCRFLEVREGECPTGPFPKSNSARAVKWQSYSAFIGPLALTLLVVASIFSWAFRRLAGTTFIDWCRARRTGSLRSTRNNGSAEQRSKKRS